MTRLTGLVRWVRLRVGRPDEGRAIVEFVFLGVLLLVPNIYPVSYTHLRAHETVLDLVCRHLLEKQKHTQTLWPWSNTGF